ncbi:MAG TPA: cytochrome b/b6 domain-containing protein [Candidatus Deferrimicrobium sp.]|nr:cytochrome b/b6 domain-containing protein [Candidatus Deferrimicrobium sp.]
MAVSQSALDSSVHVGMPCVDCHADLAGFEDYPHAEELKPVDCAMCHDDVARIFAASDHGQATNNPNAPTCVSCHNSHKILSHDHPYATTAARNLPYTCSGCHHLKGSLKIDPDIRIVDSFDRYMRGIHAQGVARGIGPAASCNDCHGMHDLKKASDPQSSVNKLMLPKTCSKCHNDIHIQYSRGIHGKALAAGILDAPNCADCHGEHELLEIHDPNSPVNPSNVADYVCGKCHNNPMMVDQFDFGSDRFSSYQDTYHGLAVKGGSLKAATCVSCHKAHDILPHSNPASSIHPNNLMTTCRKCHPRATVAFATSYTHRTAVAQFNKIDNIVKTVYIVAIVLIIGSMVVHNLIILGRFIVEKHRRTKALPSIQRFPGSMVYQHLVVTVAFVMLVITGFALRYPETWWVSILNFLGIFESARSVIHRVAAVLLLYIALHHALHLLLTKRGKSELKALWPNGQDFIHIWQNVRYHLGKSHEKPRFHRYDYTEKAEYWALVWGTLIMALTGFILWFPTFFTSMFPAWTVKIAETIHFFEAWLATLAIAVFHFFFVIFHPEQYPMSFTWLTGRMTIKECEEHHPAWYEEHLAQPQSAVTVSGKGASEDSRKTVSGSEE